MGVCAQVAGQLPSRHCSTSRHLLHSTPIPKPPDRSPAAASHNIGNTPALAEDLIFSGFQQRCFFICFIINIDIYIDTFLTFQYQRGDCQQYWSGCLTLGEASRGDLFQNFSLTYVDIFVTKMPYCWICLRQQCCVL